MGDGNGLVEGARSREMAPAPVARVMGSPVQAPKKTSGFLKKAGASVAAVLILVVALVVIIPATPSLLIKGIGENLQDSLGFKETLAMMLKLGKNVTREMLAKGEVPGEYAERLAAVGIEAGQVNSIGQFVRTNTYIANIDDAQVAAEGEYYTHGGEGELVARFDGEIITADNLVAKIDENPRLYAAYKEAANLSALYYHGDEMKDVLRRMGLSGSNFATFKNSGNYEEDEENFNEKRANDRRGLLEVGGKV